MAPGSYPVPAAGSTTRFAETDVEQLEDPSILTGEYFHEFPLAPEISPRHVIEVAADTPEEAALKAPVLAEIANLARGRQGIQFPRLPRVPLPAYGL